MTVETGSVRTTSPPPPAVPCGPRTASPELVAVVTDGLQPMLLLRRAGDEILVEAAADTRTFGEAAGQRVPRVLARIGARAVAESFVDAVHGAAAINDVVRLDLADDDLPVLEVASLRFLPIGTDRSGDVNLVLVLGDARSAARDALTNLPGRELLADRWAVAAARARRRGTDLSVLFVDLDGFKAVNDTHGHGAGDALLVEIAGRLLAVVRANDTVARYGGDEFVILVDGDLATGETVARRIVDVVGEPTPVDGSAGPAIVRVGASVGLVGVDVADLVRTSLDDAIAAADRRMYEAKHGGGAGFRFG